MYNLYLRKYIRFLSKPFVIAALVSIVTPDVLVAQSIPNSATYPGSTPAPTFGSVIINPAGAGGGGVCAVGTSGCTGLPSSVADGANVTLGSKSDAPCPGSTSTCSLEARVAHVESLLAGTLNITCYPGGICPQVQAATGQTTYSPTVTDVTTVTGGVNLKPFPGNLYSCTITMDGSQAATDQWFLADLSTLPTNLYNITPSGGPSGANNGVMINQGWVGTTAKVTISIGAGLLSPTPFESGINILISSTPAPLYTADVHAQVSCEWE